MTSRDSRPCHPINIHWTALGVHISANQTVFVDAHHGFGGVTCEGTDPVQGKVTILFGRLP
jgi:hypothetical protein